MLQGTICVANTVDLAERGRGWLVREPSLFCGRWVRWNSPYINHFTSPDSIIPNPYSSQSWDRYAYVNNNPVNATDPTGHQCVGEPEECLEDDGTTGPGFPGTGGTVSNPGAGDCSGAGCHGNDGENNNDEDNQCTNFLGQTGGCASYSSFSFGLDAPTLMMLTGAGLSLFAPEIGLPIVLVGAAFEVCAYTATPLCAAVKLLSVNVSGTIDEFGNLYLGPQISWGKSILPVVAVSDYWGVISSGNDPHVPTEIETRDSLTGFSVSAGSIATGGVNYSPFAQTYNASYYMDGFPELFSVNVNYNFFIHDFSP